MEVFRLLDTDESMSSSTTTSSWEAWRTIPWSDLPRPVEFPNRVAFGVAWRRLVLETRPMSGFFVGI